ncbi:hypothetical protein ACFY1L_35705 [Streptomyces sp. NPDC001663]|uniref:hypothetical protein n=1 Tax=Streptomyces sp. NPDC001663 TaxID=3364597 RepID=UPI0036C594A7
MRKLQRVAVVAAAIAGLSAFGAGISFAHGDGHHDDGVDNITAVANSQANAVADYDNPDGKGGHGGSDADYFAPVNGIFDAPHGK